MKRNKVFAAGLGMILAASVAFGMTACSSDDEGDTTGNSEVSAADVDVAEDLENARQVVLDTLESDDSWTQIMLAGDVDRATEKYGMLVVPYSHSDAASRVQGTIAIDSGKFTIEADSAATDQTWQIDQDGNVTEVTD